MIEQRLNKDLEVLHKSFEEYKNPIVNEMNNIKHENKAYEREVERYKKSIRNYLQKASPELDIDR